MPACALPSLALTIRTPPTSHFSVPVLAVLPYQSDVYRLRTTHNSQLILDMSRRILPLPDSSVVAASGPCNPAVSAQGMRRRVMPIVSTMMETLIGLGVQHGDW